MSGAESEPAGGTGLIAGAVGLVAVIVAIPLLLVMGAGGSGAIHVAAPAVLGSFDGTHVPAEYVAFIEAAGTRCAPISSAVLAAQIEAESGWDPQAQSAAGAVGIAQFMPATWAQWGTDYDGDGVAHARNPADAIGSQGDYMCYLAGWVQQQLDLGVITGNTLDLTLAAYNAGMGTVAAAGGVPEIRETQSYITKIAAHLVTFTAAPGVGPALAPGSASSIVDQAKVWLGTPYVWGGGGLAGPSAGGLDCSGLVRLALYQATGIELPRTANQQARDPRGIDIARDYALMRPGDIIAFSANGGGHFHHIGIYAGSGLMIHAPVPGKTVEIVPLQGVSYYENFSWTIKRYK